MQCDAMPPRRRYPASPPANPLDDENLLAEFLLRLPPRPSSLPRAAAVCKAWRRVVTDPHFLRRFRARHHGKAPLLGFFYSAGIFFPNPTLEAPDRVPASRLSVSWDVVACRDGLLVCSQGLELLVLDPMTGARSAIFTREDKLPKPLDVDLVINSTSVERLSFRLFAISTDADETKLSASVYSSDSGVWAHSVNTLVIQSAYKFRQCPSNLVGNAFCWRQLDRILWYDLETQTISIIEVREEDDEGGGGPDMRYHVVTKEGSLGARVSYGDEPTVQIWVKETVLSTDGKWVMRKTVLLDTLLPLEVKLCWSSLYHLYASRFEKENNVIFVGTSIGSFMINLESGKFTKVPGEMNIFKIHPYSSFVTAGFTDSSEK